MYFDGSVCNSGQGVGVVFIYPHGTIFEASRRLDYSCTNNQIEYEALLFGLKFLVNAGVYNIRAFGDPLLVVQQVSQVFQCNDESLNAYLNKCLKIVAMLDYFSIHYNSRHDNWRKNELAQ
jgi:ribonuclease HI